MDELDLFLESILNPKRPPTFPLSLHYSEGVKFLQLRKYKLALEQFNKAYEMDPNSFKVLVKRCKCFLGMRQFEHALADARAALQLNHSSLEVIDLKGKVEYQKGDFEAGYKTYKKGLEIRPMNNFLKIGRQLCEEAMNNSMKKETKIIIDSQDILNLKDARERKFKPCWRDKVPFLQNFLSDKEFLKQLLADSAATDVRSLCQETISLISENQRFWAMQMPCKRKTKTDKIHPRRKSANVQHIIFLISRCRFFKKRGLTDSCISECKKLMKIIEDSSDIPQNDKLNLKIDILHLLGAVYKQTKNSTLYLQCLHEELRLSQEHDMVIGFIRASHSLAKYYQKWENLAKFYKYFSILNDKLKSDRFHMFWENRDKFKNVYGIRALQEESLKEVEEAMIWAYGVEAKLRKHIHETILEPAYDIIKETYREKIGHQNVDRQSIARIISDSSESENFYPFESGSDSVASDSSISSI
ncbi:outer dynein arm-docking complex subunit 4-like [Parasteatoda tepidariorum]|uniref:outer dynein arm-docking complex subunit 4-like n=1 Tax=Parasteatoda tepidariorum TaxID=114398 RepID=UPI00077FC1EF|nr:outer dynein arm-docking complex subunit 4-like [Parasteatoda tepidariorum]XP_015920956.1 outer dynein arm-docking complex subunit 4-like [Parasteatoda tepidariorum]